MNSQLKKYLTIVGVFAVAVALFTGTALADPITPSNGSDGDNNGGRLSQMIEYMGADNWGQMLQKMNQIHGPEFTGRMIQQMNEGGFCHDGDHAGPGSMMGRGFGGMMGQGLDNQMGPGFQNGGPDSHNGGQVGPGYSDGMMDRGSRR